MALSLQIKGLDKVISELKAYPQDIEKIINNEFKVFGQDVANDAKRFAPVDEGYLRSQISSETTNFKVSIAVNASYAAFIEFGTKGRAASYVASLPKDWQELALQFKGSGEGGMDQFIRKIYEWIKRKGIGLEPKIYQQFDEFSFGKLKKPKKIKKKSAEDMQKQLAYVIVTYILKYGIKPQPFLFPAFEKNVPKLIQNLKNNLPAK